MSQVCPLYRTRLATANRSRVSIREICGDNVHICDVDIKCRLDFPIVARERGDVGPVEKYFHRVWSFCKKVWLLYVGTVHGRRSWGLGVLIP